MYILNTHPWGPNFTLKLSCSYDQPFLRYKVVKNWKCTEWSQIDLNHLTVKRTLYTLNTHPRVTYFTSRLGVFPRYKLVENWKCTEWPQNNLKNLTVKTTTYALNTHPPRPKFHSVSLYNQSFSRYKLAKNRICTEWPQNDLKHLTLKGPCIQWILTPKAQISLRFALWPAIFQIQACRKSEMYPMTLEWP